MAGPGKPAVSDTQLIHYFQARANGATIRTAASIAGFSPPTGKKYETILLGRSPVINGAAFTPQDKNYQILAASSPHALTPEAERVLQILHAGSKQAQNNINEARKAKDPAQGIDYSGDFLPKSKDELSDVALESLEDISLFASRYFGIFLAPWQEDATSRIIELIQTEEREYACINVAPGVGKTVFFTLIIPAWLICRDRTIRGMTGHASASMASRSVNNLRRTLARTVPVKASDEDLRLGLGKDAESTLARDFGRFKPVGQGEDIWRADGFTVAQVGDVPLSEKELTWSAIGFETVYIGTRVNIAVWDDADDPKRKTELTRDDMKERWDQIAEKRLEPGGTLIIQGQRLGPDDMYAYCLSKPRIDLDDDGEDIELDDETLPRKYHHIVYKAHYQEKCKGKETHKRTSAPYPVGCLLMPSRLSWRDLKQEMVVNSRNFEILYQQEDTDPAGVLVQKIWIDGGKDNDTGEVFDGCWDTDRDLLEWPKQLTRPIYSIATADPSPTKLWAIQWWLYHPQSQQRFLLDLFSGAMNAPELLDYNSNQQAHSGLMETWQMRSTLLGIPITHWIIEANAAQRFILQYNHVKSWKRKWSVSIIPHQTNVNKSDPEYGVWSLAPHYKFGRVRLPGKNAATKRAVNKLYTEVTSYPQARNDDQVLAQWFFEWNLPNLTIEEEQAKTQDRPSWAGAIDRIGVLSK